MRIGLYLGRHTGNGGGIGVYARAMVRHAVELLESHGYLDEQLVIYGDSSILDADLIEELLLSPVLTTVARRGSAAGAERYFKKLPNGARCRVLIRLLPERFGRYATFVGDQVLLPLYAHHDKLQLLHSLANYALPLVTKPQLVTVHDLYQAWPVVGKGSFEISPAEKKPAKIKPVEKALRDKRAADKRQTNREKRPGLPERVRVAQLVYRALFRVQFRKVKHVITDSEHVRQEIKTRFGFDLARITVVPLGLDLVFAAHVKQRVTDSAYTKQLEAWLRQLGLRQGYVLVFASADGRKNFSRTLEAWKALPDADRATGLVINLSDKRALSRVWAVLGEEYEKDYVQIVSGLDRWELPLLYAGARVVLIPTLAEGFGFPALEALSMGARVVSGRLEHIEKLDTQNVLICDPYSTDSIRTALLEAISEQGAERELSAAINDRLSSRRGSRALAPWRTMFEAVRETFSVYKEVLLKHKL